MSPRCIRWIFASRKPNLDFTIAFDLDVMKAYDDFDRCERYAFGAEEGEPKRVNYEKRIYELSCTAHTTDADLKGKPLPPQFGIRHLCNILQIFEGDQTRAQSYYQRVALAAGRRSQVQEPRDARLELDSELCARGIPVQDSPRWRTGSGGKIPRP
jgi:lysyl-tRNA synthetase class I